MVEDREKHGDCKLCQDWSGCSGKAWYEPADIRQYCWHQVIWIIENLEDDIYPVAPPNYSGFSSHQINPHAPFESWMMLTGEILARLSTTGESGEALIDEIQLGQCDRNELSRPARRALSYIVGSKRRKKTFPQWLAAKNYEQKRINLSPKNKILVST